VARFGGEEFVLLLPETDLHTARQAAERCRDALAELRIPHGASSVGQFVSASIGVGTVEPSGCMEPTHFIEAVDKLLYEAKKRGRNRVECGTVAVEASESTGRTGLAAEHAS